MVEVNNNKKALKSGIWYTVGNFIARAMSFLSMPLFTRLMTKSDIGDYSNFTSWVSIIGTIVTMDLCRSVIVAKYDYRKDLNKFISSILILGSSITLFFYVLCIIFKVYILNFLGITDLELHILFLYSFVSPALNIFQIKNRVEYKYKVSVLLTLLSIILSTIVSFVLVLIAENKLSGRVIGYYAPLIILNLIIYIYLLINGKSISPRYWKYSLNISIPLVWHALAGNLLASSDRVMIKRYCGSEEAALYSVAYSCAIVVSILWTSMNTAWSPWAYDQIDNNKLSELKKASKPYILFFGSIVLMFLLIAPEILLIMGGKSYKEAIIVLPPVMIAFVFQFVYSLYVNIETFYKKQKYIAVGTSIAAILNIILNYIFIPRFGYGAAAYTTLFGYATLFLVHFAFVKKLGKVNLYDTKFNLMVLLFFTILMFIMNILYHFNALRYIIIVMVFIAIIAFLIIFRKEIIFLVKNKSFVKISEKFNYIYSRRKKR